MTGPRDVVVAWIAWAVFALVIFGIVVSGNPRTVTPSYHQATAHWFRGESLYSDTGHGFLYLPHAAILFAPFAALPQPLGDVLWRLLTISAFAIGVRRLATLGGKDSGTELFPLMTYPCILLAADSARNGQATLLVTTMMVFAVVDLTDSRWWRATLWLTLGLAIKPMITLLILLAGVFYRPMRARLMAGIAILILTPFLFQQPGYVVGQYVEWTRMLGIAGKLGMEGLWANLFGMLAQAGIVTPPPVRVGILVAAALLTFALCAVARRRHTPAQAAVFLFVLHGCYLMLFNPRTETNTYSALAPAIAVLCAQAWLVDRRPWTAAGLVAVAIGVAGSYEIGTRLPGTSSVWLAPLMCVCFAAFAVVRILRPTRGPA